MLGRLNHVALAVPDLEAAARLYRETLGARCRRPRRFPEHGVSVVFVELPNTRIELMEPLGENSPIAGFLAKQSGRRHAPPLLRGGRHPRRARPAASARARASSATASRRSARTGGRCIFLSPKDFAGTLIELEEAAK